MSWAPRGFRGRNKYTTDAGSVLEAGANVRVSDALPGWGEALDRFGVVERVSLSHLKAYVRTKSNVGWVRLEDLIRVALLLFLLSCTHSKQPTCFPQQSTTGTSDSRVCDQRKP